MNVQTKVPAYGFAKFEQKLGKMSRKSKKLGLVPISWEKTSEEFTEKDGLVFTIEVTGEVPSVPGYTLLGSKERENSSVIVNSFTEEGVSEKFRSVDFHCDHCGHDRLRNKVTLIRDENGNEIQVGHSCLADYLRNSELQKMVEFFSSLATLKYEDDGSNGEGGYSGEGLVSLKTILAQTIVATEKYGWVSQSAARFSETLKSTSSRVMESMFGRRTKDFMPERFVPTHENLNKADEVISWVRGTLSAKTNKSDFEHNLSVVFEEDGVRSKRFSLVVAAPSIYFSWISQQVEIAKKKEEEKEASKDSQHVGTIKERLTLSGAEVTFKRFYENDFGGYYLVKLIHEGNVFNTFYSGNKIDFQVGEPINIRGTVKKHTEFNGVPETMLARVMPA